MPTPRRGTRLVAAEGLGRPPTPHLDRIDFAEPAKHTGNMMTETAACAVAVTSMSEPVRPAWRELAATAAGSVSVSRSSHLIALELHHTLRATCPKSDVQQFCLGTCVVAARNESFSVTAERGGARGALNHSTETPPSFLPKRGAAKSSFQTTTKNAHIHVQRPPPPLLSGDDERGKRKRQALE